VGDIFRFMSARWEPYREPLSRTLLRTIAIAVAIGIALSVGRGGGGIALLPMNVLLALWPAFGGHWIELGFLNWLRPRLPAARAVQIAARLATWFAGGIVLGLAMKLTARALDRPDALRGLAWPLAGLGFVGIELMTHAVLRWRGRPNSYEGRG
jgi:hypothetical protein